MSDSAERLLYDPRTGPDRAAWLGAPEAERTLAVRRWMKHNDLPFACCVPRNADEWREVEDQLASGLPPETGRLMDRMLGAGVARVVALWAMAETMSSPRYKHFERLAQTADSPEAFDIQRLFDECDAAILPAAFEASAGSFGPSHEEVIDYYHRHYDPDGSMPFAVAAGFSFGCAASPKFVRNHTLYEHMYGNEITEQTPAYLPVEDAYRELFRFVSDAVFEQENPIPPSVRPPAKAEDCFDSTFSDWCKGFRATQTVVAPGWEEHLARHPARYAQYLEIVDTLRFFTSREEAQRFLKTGPASEDISRASHRVHASIGEAIRRLFLLAHPVMDDQDEKNESA